MAWLLAVRVQIAALGSVGLLTRHPALRQTGQRRARVQGFGMAVML